MEKITSDELRKRQCWTWIQKVDHSLGVIDEFLSKVEGNAFVSFSGGKDSTVLYSLCRMFNKDIKAVFFNTGMEYPEIITFVRGLIQQGYNIDFINPKLKPSQIWDKYGFPLVSKEQAHKLYYMKNKPFSKTALTGFSNNSMHNVSHCFRFLINEKFDCNSECCKILKKKPSHVYQRQTGLFPIIGTMASESLLRKEQYLKRGGCNSFKTGKVFSTPLSIWNDDDIWNYIKDRDLKIAEIYKKGVLRTGCVCCGFGAHLEEQRFDALYKLHPKLYECIMNYTNHGVTFRQAIRKVLHVNGIELPDERTQLLFDF